MIIKAVLTLFNKFQSEQKIFFYWFKIMNVLEKGQLSLTSTELFFIGLEKSVL